MALGSNYYDLDELLAEEERFPLNFMQDSKGLGFLDSTVQSADLPKDSKVELPIWLALPLAEHFFGTVDAPKCFAHRFRTYLLADPVVINLRERSPFYYESGLHLASLVRDGKALVDALVKSLALRYADILDKSQNSRNEDLSNTTSGFTELERKLFIAGHKGADDMYRFKRRVDDLSAPTKRAKLN